MAFVCAELTLLQRSQDAAQRRLRSFSAPSIRKGMRRLQEVHVNVVGPIVDGQSLTLDGDAFLKQCSRAAPVVARLWRSMVTPENGRGDGGWRRKVLRSIFAQASLFRIARVRDPIANNPTSLLFHGVLEQAGASRSIGRVIAAAGLAPYPDTADKLSDRDLEHKSEVMAGVLVLGQGRAARIQMAQTWLPMRACELAPSLAGASQSTGRSRRSSSASVAPARPSTGGAAASRPSSSSSASAASGRGGEGGASAPLVRSPGKRQVRRPQTRSPTDAQPTQKASPDPRRRMSFGGGGAPSHHPAGSGSTPPASGAPAVADHDGDDDDDVPMLVDGGDGGAAGASGGTGTGDTGVSGASAPATPPDRGARVCTAVCIYTDNGNLADRHGAQQRYFRQEGVKAVAVGGLLYLTGKIDPALSHELPTYVREGRDGPREAATCAQLRRKLGTPASADDSALQQQAEAAGWVYIGRSARSKLPIDSFLLRHGHFSLTALPSGATKPLGRVRFEVSQH